MSACLSYPIYSETTELSVIKFDEPIWCVCSFTWVVPFCVVVLKAKGGCKIIFLRIWSWYQMKGFDSYFLKPILFRILDETEGREGSKCMSQKVKQVWKKYILFEICTNKINNNTSLTKNFSESMKKINNTCLLLKIDIVPFEVVPIDCSALMLTHDPILETFLKLHLH